MLEHDIYHRHALLLVLVDDHDGFGIVGHQLVHDGSGVLGVGHGAEELLDLGLGLVDIHVTDHDDTLVGGMVPLLVVVAQFLGLEVVDDRHQSDGVSFSVLRTRVELGEVALEHAAAGRGAQAPLLVDDTALLVYLLGLQQQTVCPVAQDEQARVECALACRGHVADAIDRLVDAGVGIQVASELHADLLAVGYHFVALEVVGAVEAHVFQKVGETALALLFLNGTHLLSDVEIGAVLRPVVITDVIGQPIVQFTDAYGCVSGDRRHLHLC